ncbi:MAG TPA: alkaline phosphatase family protein [Candidatus Cybelea sp.]|nr:alkaline phosphatase family protein [Candidatus Cybelea sp.]
MQPWGCWAPAGTKTNLITTDLEYEASKGPFPCFTYATLAALLDAKAVSWKCYAPYSPKRESEVNDTNPFFAVKAVWDTQSEFAAHISYPETNVLSDVANGALPAMSWVIPRASNSDAPGNKVDDGPAWVASVVNAIGESSYWDSTAVVVVWDDWGGFYDPVPPPFFDKQGGAGFRVPLIVISPYAAQGYVSHDVYGFGSIVRFIEDTWDLGRLGTTDKTSTSVGNMFDLRQAPRPFVSI